MSSTSDLPRLSRRAFVAAAAGAAVCAPALAQHAGHGTSSGTALPEAAPSADPFARLQGGTPHHLTTEQIAQRKVESPAPKGPQGHWAPKAALPLPRSEMAWATAWAGRMHIVGGYGEGRVDRAYHHVYDPNDDRWFNAAPLPRGANHVAVVGGCRAGLRARRLHRAEPQSGSECVLLRCGRRQVDDHRATVTFAWCRRGSRAGREDPSDRRRRRAHQ
jgi:hypothetical protein